MIEGDTEAAGAAIAVFAVVTMVILLVYAVASDTPDKKEDTVHFIIALVEVAHDRLVFTTVGMGDDLDEARAKADELHKENGGAYTVLRVFGMPEDISDKFEPQDPWNEGTVGEVEDDEEFEPMEQDYRNN